MPFCWFRSKSKSSYNLNHEFDRSSHYNIESRPRFSGIPEKSKFSEVNHQEDATTTSHHRIRETTSSQDLKQLETSKIGDYTIDPNSRITNDERHDKDDEDVECEQKNHKIPEDVEKSSKQKDLNEEFHTQKPDKNEEVIEHIDENEETRESVEADPKDQEERQEDEIKDKHFKESLVDSGKGSETFSNFSTFRPSSLSDISPSETENYSEINSDLCERLSTDSLLSEKITKRRSGVLPKPVPFDEEVAKSLVKYPKTDSEKQFIKNAISKNEFLSKVITGRRLQDVIDAMYKKDIRAKEKVIKEGQTGTHMYVAAEGEFEVTKKGKGLINVIKPGDVFGELAILYNAKRLATVKSSTSAKVWVIDGVVYQQLMKKSNIEEQDEIVSFLQNVQILNEVGIEVLRKVARLLKPEFFETGTVIVQEGDEGEKFYIITAGTVTVSREDEGFIGQLHKGQCFGEKAILESITRQATVTAVAPGTECLTLSQKHFIDHFGKIEDISNLTILAQTQIIIEDVKVDNAYSHVDLTEFKILKTLGVGGFGRVEFVQHKTNPSLTFALKYLKKYEMVQQDQQHHVINEKQIQMACQSSFIVRMYKTFKDNKYIYFLMEVCLGGDLWSLLQKQPNKKFEEKGARFIAACVLEALSYLHERGIVYRDLKPENLLIDNYGYIKMTDFGFAKRLPQNSKSGTFAGTPEYVAPEIILNRGHDKAVDYWAYGIFIYELLNGKTPFRSNDPSYMRTYNNILNGLEIVDFPAHVGSKAKNLITRLLKKSPEERLGCLRGGVEDIRSHVWFAGFDWERLKNCDIPSPYKPKLSSNVDTRNIDNFARDYDIPPDENSGWDEFF